MAAFRPKYLSDEDVARLLGVCITPLVLAREKSGIQEWICPTCGCQIRLCQPASIPDEHVRPEYANAWS